MFYGNILASTYKFYGRFKNETPYATSVIFTMFCQLFAFFLCFAILKHFWKIEIIETLIPNKIYMAALIGVFFFFSFKYYSKKRVLIIVEKFNKKSRTERQVWGFVSILCLIVPICLFPVLLKK
jgi:hypothetical protein